MEEEIMFDFIYEMVLGGVILGYLYVFLNSVAGCASYRPTPLEFKTRLEYCSELDRQALASGVNVKSVNCDGDKIDAY
jgi:hypothetical protein